MTMGPHSTTARSAQLAGMLPCSHNNMFDVRGQQELVMLYAGARHLPVMEAPQGLCAQTGADDTLTYKQALVTAVRLSVSPGGSSRDMHWVMHSSVRSSPEGTLHWQRSMLPGRQLGQLSMLACYVGTQRSTDASSAPKLPSAASL